MIIRIMKQEQPALLMACGLRDIPVEFYTDETSDGLLLAEIPDHLGYYIGKEVGERLAEDRFTDQQADNLFDLFKVRF